VRSNYQNTRAELFYHRVLKKIDWIQRISAAVSLALLDYLGMLQRDCFLPGQNDFLQLEGVYYSRPPFYAGLLRPLGWLSYRAAYWTFEGITSRRSGLSGSVCAAVQRVDPIFEPLLAAGCILALRKDRDFAAGLLLSLCAIKGHLFVLGDGWCWRAARLEGWSSRR
jgi:hypothetical protein